MKNIYLFIISFAFLILFISGFLIHVTEYGFLTNPLFLTSSCLLLVAILMRRYKFIVLQKNFLSLLYFIFILLGMISSLVNQDYNNFLTISKLLLLYGMTTFFVANIKKNISSMFVLNVFIISTFFILLLSLIEYPVGQRLHVYSGIFENPNSMGMLAATLFSASFILLIVSPKKNAKLSYAFISLISIYFVSIAGSRTSFLTTFLILLVIFFIYCVLKLKEQRFNLNRLVWGLPILLFGLMVLILFIDSQIYLNLQENILHKFEKKAGDITSSRTVIWNEIMKEAGFFGREAGYIKNEFNLTAHNSFFAIIIQFGWLSGGGYILFWIGALITSIRKSILFNNNKSGIISLIMISNYILLSMMEVLYIHSSAIVAMIMIGFMTLEGECIDSKVKKG